MEYISHSEEQTEQIACQLAAVLKGGETVAFYGGLGMGKTCFVRGLAKGLGYSGSVSSPTFAIVNEYKGGRFDLYHFDMYRISNWEDLFSTGFYDYLEYDNIIAVEWSENIEAALPDNTIRVTFTRLSDTQRKIVIEGDITL